MEETSILERLESILEFIKRKIEDFQCSELHSFKEFINEEYRLKKGILQYCGAYVIYEGNKPIYVGSAGKGKHYLRYRVGDLFHVFKSKAGEIKYYHTLTRKLLHKYKRFNSLDEVREFYLSKCRIRIIKTDTIREARIIEAILICLLNPCYND